MSCPDSPIFLDRGDEIPTCYSLHYACTGKSRILSLKQNRARIFTEIYSLYPMDIEAFVLPDGARPSQLSIRKNCCETLGFRAIPGYFVSCTMGPNDRSARVLTARAKRSIAN